MSNVPERLEYKVSLYAKELKLSFKEGFGIFTIK